VSDQFSIFFGSTSRRHRFPRLYASTLSHNRTSLERNRWQLSRVILTACLPFAMLDLAELFDTVESGEGQQKEQSAESDHQHDPAVGRYTAGRPG